MELRIRLLYTCLFLSYGHVNPHDVQLFCPESTLFSGESIILTCVISRTNYPENSISPAEVVEFRSSSDNSTYLPMCTIASIDLPCDYKNVSSQCGCVERTSAHYILRYKFVGVESNNTTWDCLINCLDGDINPAITFESYNCNRRSILRKPSTTTPSSSSSLACVNLGTNWRRANMMLFIPALLYQHTL